jgi:uncharacterized protein
MKAMVDNYIESLPLPQQQEICHKLRSLLLEHCPTIVEKYSFKIPFYHLHGSMFCYFNKVGTGIEFCLCRGKEMALAFDVIVVGERKLIGGILLEQVKDIHRFQVVSIIHAAAELQLEYYLQKKNKKGR